MDPETAPSPQANSTFALEPVNGLMLYHRETSRRNALLNKGNLLTGCSELDDEVLAGGFERGCIVGVSAEQDEFGLLVRDKIGLQTIARLLAAGELATAASTVPRARVMIITTLDMAALLPTLSAVLETQAGILLRRMGSGDPVRARAVAHACLEQISISRVFDLEGVWEVLKEDLVPETGLVDTGITPPSPPSAAEAERQASDLPTAKPPASQSLSQPGPEGNNDAAAHDMLRSQAGSRTVDGESSAPSPLPPELPSFNPTAKRTEIMDSEDEMSPLSSSSSELSPPPPSSPLAEDATGEQSEMQQPHVDIPKPPSSRSSSLSPPPSSSGEPASEAASPQPPAPPEPQPSPAPPATVDQATAPRPLSKTPDMILVTHMSLLMTALFRRRDRQSAHSMLTLLDSHLQHVSRSPEYGSPLIMLLNATNAPLFSSSKVAGEHNQHHHQQNGDGPPPPLFGKDGGGSGNRSGSYPQRPLDPTLRSIFNIPYVPEIGHSHHGNMTDAATTTRRNKPVYGLVFAQLLDLHLLATLVPRQREDVEAALVGAGHAARYAWVVEVLLDEQGAWRDGVRADGEAPKPRICREQRWGVVEVKGGGVVVVDAFEKAEPRAETRAVEGFGGQRV